MKPNYLIQVLLLIIILLISCESKDPSAVKRIPNQNTLFEKIDPQKSGVTFLNEVTDGKEFNVLTYRNFYNGGGVGIGDINNDGLDDIFFTANMNPNKLYLNKGDLKFEEISESAGITGQRGWTTGVSMADINNDGWLDIYVSNSGDVAGDDRENELYINNGDLTFTERAEEYNLNHGGFTTHASFFDYDLDGDLDVYILNNSFRDPSKLASFSKTREVDDVLGGDRLMRNDNGYFTDVSEAAGIYTSGIGFGLGVSVSDINHDYMPDIYISNDFWERDYIYINQGDGTFAEELTDRVNICSVSSMGADIADLNNDGHFDIYTTDMLAADNFRLKAHTIFDPVHLTDLKYRSSFHYQVLQNCLHINDGSGNFQERAHLTNAAATDWSWGALIFDFDNDGWNDIFVCNGVYKDILDQDFSSFIADQNEVKEIVTKRGEFDFRDFASHLTSTPLSNYAFVNKKNNQFENQAEELGLGDRGFSNGAAYSDLDNDGDLDLVINNVNKPADIYKNKSNEKGSHFLKVALLDESGANRNAIGATVNVTLPQGGVRYKQNYTVRGFQSSMSGPMLFGLGESEVVNEVEVIWPDKTIQTIKNPTLDQIITIKKNTSKPAPKYDKEKVNSVLQLAQVMGNEAIHKENVFNDFDHERLLPRMLSTEGPRQVTGDVNGDGLTDMILLGAKNQIDKVFIQSKNGQFSYKPNPAFSGDITFESTCGALFDADGDGDLDLAIGSGGNDLGQGMSDFILRYYDNDGNGTFVRNTPMTPPAGGQFSVIAPSDFDKDGDMDLFIGARSIPGNYGLSPRSFLLRKNANGWEDITQKSLGTVGMITDAAWTDFDNDGDDDLMIVGEYMPITVFLNDKSGFQKSVTIPNSEGWWLDVNPADIDGDGDMDYVLGNWGLNTKFKASADEPIELYVKDFDGNGKSEFVINWMPPGDEKRYPFHTKMDITAQLPSLKKRFLKYKDFASADYNQLLTPAERKGALKRQVVTMRSAVLYNEEGAYVLASLPLAAQVAPMFTSAVDDFDGDGHNDIWMGGNFYGLKPEVGRHNESRGVLLLGSENNTFVEANDLMPQIEGEVRDAQIIKNQKQNLILISINDGQMTALKY